MEKEEKQQALCLQILQTCRNELYDLFPFLDGAFTALDFGFCAAPGFRVDGQTFYANPKDLLTLYSEDPAALRRGCLHTLLHCLFLHPFTAGQGRTWDLACDMAVERIIAGENIPRLGQPGTVKADCLSALGESAQSPQQIEELLKSDAFPFFLEEMEAAFRFDDHSCWQEKAVSGRKAQWERLLMEAAGKKSGKGKRGSTPGKGEEIVDLSKVKPFDYRTYLRRFTVPREEVELDMESFDYIFYNFGMENYGSMPLIEPLEYKEVRRLEELVIAIDTSGSCSAETVSRFLSETYAILSAQENFFRRMKVYFLQCDCLIQDVTCITSREEWLSYAQKIRIQGRGGTDFTPVFSLVEKLRAEKELTDLKALLYFTDGDGVYPTQPPDYETAFVLLKETGHPELVPAWGKLLLI